jgi:hypothetical protein
MKRIEKTLERGSGYTLLILILFYLFAVVANFESKSISFSKFLLILAFGMMISVAELIYSLLNMKAILKIVIHYALLLTSFLIIFLTGDFFTLKGFGGVLVAVIIFTFLYFVIYGIIRLIRVTVGAADKAIDNRKAAAEHPEAPYTPRFKM